MAQNFRQTMQTTGADFDREWRAIRSKINQLNRLYYKKSLNNNKTN